MPKGRRKICAMLMCMYVRSKGTCASQLFFRLVSYWSILFLSMLWVTERMVCLVVPSVLDFDMASSEARSSVVPEERSTSC